MLLSNQKTINYENLYNPEGTTPLICDAKIKRFLKDSKSKSNFNNNFTIYGGFYNSGLNIVQTIGKNYKVPRSICSRSMDSNNALKFPAPKPRAPMRWMISKNKVGRS